MWEVFTEGRMPFEQNQNHEVVTMVTKGQRLHRPKMAPLAIYDIMQLTWQEVSCIFIFIMLMSQFISPMLKPPSSRHVQQYLQPGFCFRDPTIVRRSLSSAR